jgi:hypothetical protein
MIKKFAKVVWSANDIQVYKAEWSIEECELWLEANEKRIAERMTEVGWQVIEDLLPD